jgi:RNA polymerase sigma-70 factor (ECF subfamily)
VKRRTRCRDAWLRFADAKAPDDAGRYLSRIVTNLCLDRLKSASRRRETYAGHGCRNQS